MGDRTAHDAAASYDFRVGDWLVAPRGNRLVGLDGPVRLEPKVMQVLACLAAQPGRTVTKEEFMEQVWADTVVSDDVLARCVSELRKTFGDDPRAPTYIETVRKSGYRLIAPVAPPEAALPDEVALLGVERAPGPTPEEPVADPEVLGGDGPDVPVAANVPAPEPAAEAHAPVGDVRPAPAPSPPDAQAPRRLRREAMLWSAVAATVLLLLVVGVVAWPRDGERPLKAVPFTSFPGPEAEPTLSPDGEQIAFTWTGEDGGPVDVYVKQAGAEMPLQITDTPADEWSPTWSPDGRQLAFVRSTDRDTRAVVVVPAIGGSERTLVELEGREVGRITWSPDGETIALSAQAERTGPFSLFLLAVETLGLRRLTEPDPVMWGDVDPAFAPGGERVAFVRSVNPGVEDLFVVPVRGGEPERLTTDERDVAGLDWTPDGQQLVFASNRAEGAGLWRIAVAGGPPEPIATAGEGEGVRQPSVSRHGRRLIYEQRSADANIWALRRGQFGRSPLIRSTRWESHPQFAPAGDRIAFASDRSGTPEVWVVDADGQNPIRLTDLGGPLVTTPRWSPDGRQIAFGARVDGNADIYTIDSNGGRPVRLTEHPASDVAPSWSLDSTTVYFSSDRSGTWEVWRMPAAGGSPRRVTYRGGYNAFESPDGRMLYYAKQGEPGLWRRGPDGEDETLVLGALEPFDWGNWAVTDEGIYFIRREATGPTIRFFSFATGWSSPVARLDDVPEQPALAVSPDGRVLLYTHVDRDESDLLLVEDFQ